MNQGFIWGTVTSSYQIGGAADEDGEGFHIRNVYSRQPRVILDNHNGDVVCDHYHRYREDVALMKEIGIQGHCFFVSQLQILSERTGKVNEKGLAFCDKLINELISNGVRPYVTLLHWDYPYELYQQGGWMSPDSVGWSAECAKTVAEYFSDRTTCFITFSGPQCFIGMGHMTGHHTPGLKNPLRDTFLTAHRVMMAHRKAIQAMRAVAKQPILVGYAPTFTVCASDNDRTEDIETIRSLYFRCSEKPEERSWNVGWWNDPMTFDKYLEDGIRQYAPYLPDIRPEDLASANQPIDFCGQNIYNSYRVRQGGDGRPECVKHSPGYDKTAVG